MKEEIGGYFEWEFQNNFCFPHEDGVLLNTGRNALEYILRSFNHINMVYVPLFTCPTIKQTISKLNLDFKLYDVNEALEIDQLPDLGTNDYLLYTNYFGLKDDYVKALFLLYGTKLIIDSAQSFFSPVTEGMNIFFTPHKFVGVPRGAIAYTSGTLEYPINEKDFTSRDMSHTFIRFELPAIDGFEDSQKNAKKSRNQSIKKMSELTFKSLRNIDFEKVCGKRIKNVDLLDRHLDTSNLLKLPMRGKPLMCYPYLTNDLTLKGKLIKNKVFCATYWPRILEECSQETNAFKFAQKIVPLPIDQRYGAEEMEYIIKVIKDNEEP